MQDRFATIGETRLHYVEEGEGPLVVLLHGFPEFWYSWRHQIPVLAAAGYRVIAPDLRGYNDSSKPRGIDAYRLTAVVQDIAGLIVQNGGTCMLVGHDWGGVAAWLLPMLHPTLVEKLVVLNSPHPVPLRRELKRSFRQKWRFAYQLFFQLPRIPEWFMRTFGIRMLRRAGRFTEEDLRTYAEAWRKPAAMTSMLNYYRALRRHSRELGGIIRPIEMPAMLIWGERDPVFLRETTENFGEWVPKLRVERIGRAGHFVQTDAADEVNRLLVEFLRY
jgi:pimeloyl-ACP methyl ester carboxylesterase